MVWGLRLATAWAHSCGSGHSCSIWEASLSQEDNGVGGAQCVCVCAPKVEEPSGWHWLEKWFECGLARPPSWHGPQIHIWAQQIQEIFTHLVSESILELRESGQ